MTIRTDDIPLSLLEQTADEEDICEIFHENSKFWPSTLLPVACTISAFLTRPPDIERSARGFNADPFVAPIALRLDAPAQTTLCEALANRRSVRSFSGAPIELNLMGQILSMALRANRIEPLADKSPQYFRPYPSGGALFPIEFYIFFLQEADCAARITRYSPRTHQLFPIADHLDQGALGRAFPSSQGNGAAVAIVLTAVFQRSTAKYGPRGYRFALLEAGHAGQNICLAASALGLGAVLDGGYFDDALNAFVHADGVLESVVSTILIGHPK
jgi:SagB-type dehydrogenase family enzyme